MDQKNTDNKASLSEQGMLARYVVTLEIRNPKTFAKMKISKDEIKQIVHQTPGTISQNTLISVTDFVSKPNTGNLSAGLLITNDDIFEKVLLSLEAIESRFDKPSLFTSNYHVGRVGRYDKTCRANLRCRW